MEPAVFETYKLIVEDTNQLGSRRQTVDTVYEGIVTLILGADGYVAATSQFHGWLAVVVTTALSVIGIVFTVHWRRVVERLKDVLSLRYEYLRELEENNDLKIIRAQIYSKEWDNIYAKRAAREKKRTPFGNLQSLFIIIFIVTPLSLAIITVLASLPFTQSYIVPLFSSGR